ncbi:hypothetical protein EDD11_001376 [Mortierella claussenii]|nr:hypothetical protein EDD11_001376 [Mortierella claussenii]
MTDETDSIDSRPESPIPTIILGEDRPYDTREESNPLMRRLAPTPQSPSTSLPGARESDDHLNEALAEQMKIGESISESSVKMPARTRSQDTFHTAQDRPPHRVRSVDDNFQYSQSSSSLPAHERAEGDMHLQEQRDFDESTIGDWGDENEDGDIQPEQRIRGMPQACLFVASLAASRTEADLVESVTAHFRRWGSLLNVKVLKDWMQRPYSFVQFEHIEDAQRALTEAQNTIIDGRHIRIEQARVNRTLFILRFGRTTTEQDLTEVLAQYGPVEDVSIFQDLGPSRNKRYAFAKFAYRDDAIRAYMSLRGNSKWTVEWAPNLSNQIDKESVFVGQLNPELVTEGVLHERFQDYGSIQNIHLVKRIKPGTNLPTAFAFIEFDDEQSARQAIDHEDNTSFLGNIIRVQHREASEYRLQRQNAAIQAARSLNAHHPIGPPAVDMPTPPTRISDYRRGYTPYRGLGRPMYYTTYYAYTPQGMPVAGPGFVPQPGAMYVPPGGASRGSTMSPYSAPGLYQGNTPYGNQTPRVGPYSSIEEAGAADRQGYEYGAYMQSPEGMYYPSALSTRVYMYDQGSGIGAIGASNPAGIPLSPTIRSAPSTPPVNPMWYNQVRSVCNMHVWPTQESVGTPCHYNAGPSTQSRTPEASSSPAGPPARPPAMLDSRSPSRKTT